ncbi:TPA: YjbQ family protein [Vibrio vulnificus]|nr:YjbQ family protein [Vibrio vulnificus]
MVTDEILRQLPELSKVSVGLAHIFIQHTSASLTINKNADPTVREDFESFFKRAVPEDEPYYKPRCILLRLMVRTIESIQAF